MFTGIIEERGTIVAITDLADAIRLTIRGPKVLEDAKHGDSIAVSGCCLTVTTREVDTFDADVMKESLDKTTLGTLNVGDEVNLERAMSAGGRLGGHIVQGHVDGTGEVVSREPSEHWELFTIAAPADIVRYLVAKGSITIDGTSLTVVDVHAAGASAHTTTPVSTFTVSLIPTTLRDTTLGQRRVGDRVNLEIDILAKYVERLLS